MDHPRSTLHVTAKHAAWLNQVECAFSILTVWLIRFEGQTRAKLATGTERLAARRRTTDTTGAEFRPLGARRKEGTTGPQSGHSRRVRRQPLGPTGILLAFALLSRARAASADASDSVTVAAGGGQGVLAARLAGGDLVYKVCAQTPCTPASGDGVLHLAAGPTPSTVVLDVLAVGQNRRVLWAHAATHGALLAAVPNEPAARVLWSGRLGAVRGETGEQTGELVQVTAPDADGVVRVLWGDVREDVSICGRPSLLSPRVLDPRDLSWKGAIVQRLSPEERENAPTIVATPAPSNRARPIAHLLQAVAASSAIGSPTAVTDGDPATFWAEQRGGDGRGEFVQLNVPEQVDLLSLSLIARPTDHPPPKGVAPKKIWLATPDALYGVTFPEDGWGRAGAEYELRFPAPLRTRCLALVLDEAYARGKASDFDVTISEVSAHTEFDQNPSPAALAGALAGGQGRARMAASILTRAGTAGFEAVIAAYPQLDDAGRVLGLEIIDNAPCELSAPLYVQAMSSGKPGEVRHAIDRILRCGRAAAPPLMEAIAKSGPAVQTAAAEELALVAPDLAVEQLVDLLPKVSAQVRVGFRAALARATASPRADEVVRNKLLQVDTPVLAAVDLLRALRRPRPALVKPAAETVVRISAQSSDFRTRYLLLGPAAELARAGDQAAADLLVRALVADADAHVRAHAAQAGEGLPQLSQPLIRAVTDSEPRVRDAALATLARGDAGMLGAAVPGALDRLRSDPWTFVRQHAAELLARAPANDQVDESLAEVLEQDAAPPVRARVAEALGRRRAIRYASALAERLSDDQEDAEVRAMAARALGRVCSPKYVGILTTYAQTAATPGADAPSQAIGMSATAALGQLAPANLPKRLAPLIGAGYARPLRDAAKAALEEAERCPR